MLKYKALYKKMMDDLKDAEMWLSWAKKLEKEEPEISKYLYLSAKARVMNNLPEAKNLFDQMCEKDPRHECADFRDLIEDHLCEWREHVEAEIKKWK